VAQTFTTVAAQAVPPAMLMRLEELEEELERLLRPFDPSNLPFDFAQDRLRAGSAQDK
jgi:hypothetical protein